MKEEMPYGKKRNRTPVFDHYFPLLYLPIAVLIVLSFNDSKSRVQWGGYTALVSMYLKAGPL